MRYPAAEKLEIIRLVEQSHLPVRRVLELSPYSEAATNERDARGRLSLGRATDGLSPAIFPYE